MRQCLLVLLAVLASVDANGFKVPATVVIDGGRMHAARAQIVAGSACAPLKKALTALKTDADSWLSKGPWSVVDKGVAAPGGTIHDYLSKAPYFWPTKNKTDDNPLGCPYVEKDGIRNPEVDVGTDRQAIGSVCYAVPSLAFAWYYTNNSAYSKHAADIVRTWFLDPATAMNPNIDHGQVITCSNTGRSIGVIDFSQMYTSVLDAVAVLNAGPAPGWTSADMSAFVSWNKQFYTWLANSTFGKQEVAQSNNHGTFADMQLAAIALFVGDKAGATTIANAAKSKRIDVQIASDGSQPQELTRTRSFHYSNFDLVAYTRLAQIASKVGVDLWSYKGAKGQSIMKAVEFIVPAASGTANWTYPELEFTRYAASDIAHSAADAGNKAAAAAVSKLETPPKGDLWAVRPAAEQLDSIAG
ncbi:chondroitin AC/alginate lyase [Exidia glandulosa HHB12029]|uniref:Chondroitin AC/alginate lyase n=1 Tax=Exidia glandulosa HHB12029 TaxID=1314781 RepID=A0A165CT61_EXIGL|nr:chondroitin AC/alginate lyase [Exidia glandulosa HHB12029]